MKDFLVKEIEPNTFFTKTVYLDRSFVIAAPEMPFSEEIKKTLEKWSFDKLQSDGELNKEYIQTTTTSTTANAAATATATKGETAHTGGIKDLSSQSDSDKLEKAEEFYSGFLYFVEDMFARASVSGELDFKIVTEKIKDMVEYIREERRFLMRVLKNIEPASGKNYIATHSVRSTILSIIIGTYLKLPNHRLIELGVAALLHEAGMLKLPSNIYLSNRTLTPHEQKAIITHPILGYSMLKSFDFPLPICLAALEHHERENGSGYPRQLGKEKIGLYSKIIAVACSYEALSSKRPHKEAKDGYTGMLELLKNEGKQYDDTVVKALVLSLSIYPIGLYVLLSNGKKGQVVDVNPENPRFPIVQIFGESTPDGKVKTVQTEHNELTIVRPLNRSEIET
ncbi:MAG: HD-GYP domain-containing protein [Treponema sp.]|jgi:HD-GYP domain-containing protein (c-di-GMP phosphodiesterase class II)|nr:HD-GYP domain-containing protein [Treponema sp.]